MSENVTEPGSKVVLINKVIELTEMVEALEHDLEEQSNQMLELEEKYITAKGYIEMLEEELSYYENVHEP